MSLACDRKKLCFPKTDLAVKISCKSTGSFFMFWKSICSVIMFAFFLNFREKMDSKCDKQQQKDSRKMPYSASELPV